MLMLGQSARGVNINLTYSEVSDATSPKRTLSAARPNGFEVSPAAKSLIRGLIQPNSKKRTSIHKLKQHEFFKPLKWSDVENCRIRMPKVDLKDPKSGQFDMIEPDSCDEDFEHEYEALCEKSSNNSGQFAHLADDLDVEPRAN